MLTKDAFGRLWSDELESWLAVEPEGLRLYTDNNVLRLTEAEAHQQRAEAEQLRAEAAQHRAEAQERRATAQEERAKAHQQRAEKLAEMLRKLGHNPDELL